MRKVSKQLFNSQPEQRKWINKWELHQAAAAVTAECRGEVKSGKGRTAESLLDFQTTTLA